jgi:transducin (beta)-like 1
LLSKALLYLEVESHWRADGLTNNCKTGISLLEPHICSLAEPSEKTTSAQDIPMDISESGRLPTTRLPLISTGTQPYAKSQASSNGAQIFDGRSLEQQEESEHNKLTAYAAKDRLLGFAKGDENEPAYAPHPLETKAIR